MTPLISKNKSRLLLVEGKEDKQFFIRLGYHLKFTDDTPLHIVQYEGKDNLTKFLMLVMNDPKFNQVTRIGIVRDADYNTDAFQSVLSSLQFVNQNSSKKLPIPESAIQPSEGTPRISILILPSIERNGMLEDIVLDALQDDPIASCVDDYFVCLKDNGIEIVPERLSKARVRVFISGKNVDGQSTEGDDTDKLYLSDIFSMSWWRDEFWEHPSFEPTKQFLRQLTSD
jgi:hypothetical protein